MSISRLAGFTFLLGALWASTLGAGLQSACADNRNLIVQTTASDCGPAALATLLNFYLQIPATEKEMVQLSGANKAIGTTLLGLEKAAIAKGCAADSFRMDFATLQEQLNTFAAPVIVNLMNQEPHFAVVLQADNDYVYLADPAFGNVVYRTADFMYHWASPAPKTANKAPESTAAGNTSATNSAATNAGATNDVAASVPLREGFVFVAVGPNDQAGRAPRREMVTRLKRQIAQLKMSRPPVAVFRR